MELNEIKSKIKKVTPRPMDDDLRFSVLVPLIEIEGELHIIYEVRSKYVKQPGEVSFPGGKIEENESPQYAAVRETCEELGIDESRVEIISELDYATSKSGSFVYTFLGHIKNVDLQRIEFNRDEVDKLFFVPFSFFLNNEPEKYYMNYLPKADDDFPYHMVNNGEKYDWESIRYPVYFYDYKGHIIWGLTAKVTYNLIRKLKYN
ncbi:MULTISPECIES: NUDIX hydrolase [unclassified Sedimentibacter]|uniref:NUDIX hydrolase n=1 Tax=unclassified Sedimentibacter TaxID=2649220 RepID=UPI0027E1AEDD|nr:CoA pyrophosphatase [Sedimentibacter sp. MB35-C1]WMJ78347.1 CoA pyrophosphatase [Sedimentibacter sp. MB35-C1]